MKKILSLFLLVFIITITIAGCAVFKDNPSANAAAVGNGGLAVMKGDYLYFVNGFVSKDENFNGNSGKKIYQSAIYRVKAKDVNYSVFDGNIEFEPGTLESDEYGNIKGAKRLVSKIAGFEHSALYIFGDTLYFTSPGNAVNIGNGQTRVDDVDVFRININGNKLKKMYTIKDYSSNGAVNFYKNGKDIYGVFYNGTDTMAVYKNNKKLFDRTGVSQLVMQKFSQDFKEQNIKSGQVVFFIQNNELYRFKTGSKEPSKINTNSSLTLIDVKFNNLFYFVDNRIYAIDIGFFNIESEQKVISYESFSSDIKNNYLIVGSSENFYLVVVDTEIHYVKVGVSPDKDMICEYEGTKLLFSRGEFIYFAYENSIYELNVATSGEPRKLTGDDECVFNGTNFASFDGRHIYYFKKIPNSEINPNADDKSIYLERTDIFANQDDDFARQGISVRLEKDYNEIEEEE